MVFRCTICDAEFFVETNRDEHELSHSKSKRKSRKKNKEGTAENRTTRWQDQGMTKPIGNGSDHKSRSPILTV